MGTNILIFGWNRPLPGREKLSAEHFQDFVAFLGGDVKGNGRIQSFDVVFLDPHGGDLNGFFLIRGDSAQLDALVSSDEWVTHMTRATLHLDGVGVIRGVTGDEIMKRMALWTSTIPS
jgi:hypothetical protein